MPAAIPARAAAARTARAPRSATAKGGAKLRVLRPEGAGPRLTRPADAQPGGTEAARLAALEHYDILDTEVEPQFDLIARLASELTGCPVALINLIDAERVWTKAAVGMPRVELDRAHAYCAMAIESPQLECGGLYLPDLCADPRTRNLPMTVDQGFRMYAGVPLLSACQRPIGTLAVMSTEPRELTERQREWLSQLALQAMALLELRRKQRELQQAQAELRRLAHTDALTGLQNLRAWTETFALERERDARWGGGHALLALDLDHFKQTNDSHGHAAGDALLVAVGALLQRSFRKLDGVARIGGEEFAVLLPHTSLADATLLAERLRAAIAALRVPFDGIELRITASIGVAHSSEAEARAEGLMALADARGYQAKRAGRDRVVAAA